MKTSLVLAMIASGLGFSSLARAEVEVLHCMVAGGWTLRAAQDYDSITLTYSKPDSESMIRFPGATVVATEPFSSLRGYAITRAELAGGAGPLIVVAEDGSAVSKPLVEVIAAMPMTQLIFAAELDADNRVTGAIVSVFESTGDNDFANEYTTCVNGSVTRFFDLLR